MPKALLLASKLNEIAMQKQCSSVLRAMLLHRYPLFNGFWPCFFSKIGSNLADYAKHLFAVYFTVQREK